MDARCKVSFNFEEDRYDRYAPNSGVSSNSTVSNSREQITRGEKKNEMTKVSILATLCYDHVEIYYVEKSTHIPGTTMIPLLIWLAYRMDVFKEYT